MQAFNGSEDLKARVLGDLDTALHRFNNIIGIHGTLAEAWNLPRGLLMLLQTYVQYMPRANAKQWLHDCISAIPVGANASSMLTYHLAMLLLHPRFGVIRYTFTPEQFMAILRVAQLQLEGCDEEERWDEARRLLHDTVPEAFGQYSQKHGRPNTIGEQLAVLDANHATTDVGRRIAQLSSMGASNLNAIPVAAQLFSEAVSLAAHAQGMAWIAMFRACRCAEIITYVPVAAGNIQDAVFKASAAADAGRAFRSTLSCALGTAMAANFATIILPAVEEDTTGINGVNQLHLFEQATELLSTLRQSAAAIRQSASELLRMTQQQMEGGLPNLPLLLLPA